MKLDDKIAELESILGRFESEDLSIEEGIALFEKGISLTKECLGELNAAKGKITKLKKEMDKLVEEPLDFEE